MERSATRAFGARCAAASGRFRSSGSSGRRPRLARTIISAPQRQNGASRMMIGRGIPSIHNSRPRPKPIMSSYGCSVSREPPQTAPGFPSALARKQDQQDDDRDWNSQQPKQNGRVRSPFVICSVPRARESDDGPATFRRAAVRLRRRRGLRRMRRTRARRSARRRAWRPLLRALSAAALASTITSFSRFSASAWLMPVCAAIRRRGWLRPPGQGHRLR